MASQTTVFEYAWESCLTEQRIRTSKSHGHKKAPAVRDGQGLIFPGDNQGVTLTRRKPFKGVPFDPVRLNVRYS